MKIEIRREKWLLTTLLLWLACAPLAQAFYNPSTGRWISRDPIEEKGSKNIMTFAKNNPVNSLDRLGLDVWIMKDCSGLIQHRYVVGTNGDGTYWQADFGPTSDNWLRRASCPGIRRFSKITAIDPNDSEDEFCVESHLEGSQHATEMTRDLAEGLANRTKHPRYTAGCWDCRDFAKSLMRDFKDNKRIEEEREEKEKKESEQ